MDKALESSHGSHLAKELRRKAGVLSPQGGAWWVGEAWGGATEGTPLGEAGSPLSCIWSPGPAPPTCNKEIMPFLILYLPRMPVIFFISESQFSLDISA